MPALKSLLLALILISFGGITAHADMEPFYKGDWGMTTAKVEALYAETPVAEYHSQEIRLTYQRDIAGRPAEVVYTFIKTGFVYHRTPLFQVECRFDINDVPLADCPAFAARMVELLTGSHSKLTGDNYGRAREMRERGPLWLFYGSYINDDTYVYLSGQKGQGLEKENYLVLFFFIFRA